MKKRAGVCTFPRSLYFFNFGPIYKVKKLKACVKFKPHKLMYVPLPVVF